MGLKARQCGVGDWRQGRRYDMEFSSEDLERRHKRYLFSSPRVTASKRTPSVNNVGKERRCSEELVLRQPDCITIWVAVSASIGELTVNVQFSVVQLDTDAIMTAQLSSFARLRPGARLIYVYTWGQRTDKCQ